MRREVILEPMSPYERRIIHTALSESQTVTTKSEGKEPNRYVVIVPFDKDEFSKPYNAGRNNEHSRERRGGSKFNGRNKKTERKSSGFISVERKKTSGFGSTYLGNSFKDKI
jgi:spoIIIJ-associated protein